MTEKVTSFCVRFLLCLAIIQQLLACIWFLFFMMIHHFCCSAIMQGPFLNDWCISTAHTIIAALPKTCINPTNLLVQPMEQMGCGVASSLRLLPSNICQFPNSHFALSTCICVLHLPYKSENKTGPDRTSLKMKKYTWGGPAERSHVRVHALNMQRTSTARKISIQQLRESQPGPHFSCIGSSWVPMRKWWKWRDWEFSRFPVLRVARRRNLGFSATRSRWQWQPKWDH